MARNDVRINFLGNATGLLASMAAVRKSALATSTTLKSKLMVAGRVAGAGILLGLGMAAKAGFKELVAGEKVSAQTAAVLKSTGAAAKVTQKQVEGLADAISNKTGVDETAIREGQNLLLTFTRIRNETGKGNDIFDRTTKTLVDMSVAMGTDAKSQAIQLGKALNDPIRGLASLRRVGVQFTEAQEKQIKTMVEAGNVAGAQKVILKELEVQFGGSAEAAGQTLAGSVTRAKETFVDLSAELLTAAMPAIMAVTEMIAGLVTWLRENKTAAKVLVTGLAILGVALLAMSGPVTAVILGITAVAVGLKMAWERSKTFRTIVKTSFAIVQRAVTILRDIFSGAFGAMLAPIGAVIGAIGAVVSAVATAVNAIRGLFATTKTEHAGARARVEAMATVSTKHAGGVVPGPRGRPTPIMALGGERVLSPGQSGGGGGVTFNISSFDPRGAADLVVEALREFERGNGPLFARP